MEYIELGMLARSKAGHDYNEIYIIVDIKEGIVLLADGKYKTLEKPKVKNIKHIQIIKQKNESLSSKLINKEKVYDEEVKRVIKEYKKSIIK